MAILPPDPLYCFKSNMGHLHNICFIADNVVTTHLLAANEDGLVYLWDLETNRVLTHQKVGKSIQTIHYVDSYLITQEKSGLVTLWTTEDENRYVPVKRYHCVGGFCRSILVNDTIILPDVNCSIVGIHFETFERTCRFVPEKTDKGYVMSMEIAEINEKQYIIGGYESGDMVLWDLMTSKQCSTLRLKEYITAIAFDSVIGRGVCGNSSNVLQFFTINKDLKITLKCEVTMTNEGCSVLSLRPDRKILACGGCDGRLRLYSWKSLRLLVALSQHHKAITDVKFSPKSVPEWNSTVMAVASADGCISLWNLYK